MRPPEVRENTNIACLTLTGAQENTHTSTSTWTQLLWVRGTSGSNFMGNSKTHQWARPPFASQMCMKKLYVTMHAFNLALGREKQADPWVWGGPGLSRETLCWKTIKKETTNTKMALVYRRQHFIVIITIIIILKGHPQVQNKLHDVVYNPKWAHQRWETPQYHLGCRWNNHHFVNKTGALGAWDSRFLASTAALMSPLALLIYI